MLVLRIHVRFDSDVIIIDRATIRRILVTSIAQWRFTKMGWGGFDFVFISQV